MNEQKWLTSEEPYKMMLWYQSQHHLPSPNNHKMKMYCLACCWDAETTFSGYPGIGEDAERCIQMNSSPANRPYQWAMVWSGDQSEPLPINRADIIRDIFGNPFREHPPLWREEIVGIDLIEYKRQYPHMKRMIELHSDKQIQQKVRRGPDWITQDVTDLVKLIYQERRGEMCSKCKGKGYIYAGFVKDLFHEKIKCDNCEGRGYKKGCRLDQLSIMALCDMMLENWCYDEPLLDHLRDPKQHYYGCWALDLILGV